MRFCQFIYKNVFSFGVELEKDGFIALLDRGINKLDAKSVLDVVKAGQPILDTILKGIEENAFEKISKKDVEKYLSPLTNPDKVICVGMNYFDHCAEQNLPVPKDPLLFNKFPSCIIGPYDDLIYPKVTDELDWEVELAIIIGKKGKFISKENAMDYVFGFTAAHDVSARDWQLKKNGGQWLVGKAMDGFSPLGPVLVTKGKHIDPHKLNLKCIVNGVTKQDSNTEQMVFKTEEIISWASQLFTLLPGDIILTGTPPGVGVFMKPDPQFLKIGDVVECSIEGIGSIINTVVKDTSE